MNKKPFLLAAILFCALWSCDTISNADSISGCTDPISLNYNPDATIDDNSCEYYEATFLGSYRIIASCTVGGQSNASNYDVVIEQTDNAAYNLKIRNLFNGGKAVYGNIAGDDLVEIPEQNVDAAYYRGSLVIKDTDFSGSAFGSPDSDCQFSGKKL